MPFPRARAGTDGKGTDAPPVDPATAEAVQCANRVDGECSFLHPSQEELVEMARCATIKYDYPPDIMASTPLDLPADVVETGSINAREKEQLVAATDEFRAELRKEFEALLRDMGGSRDEIAAMSLEAMQAAITAKEPVEEVQRARRQIARERAGLERPVAPRTPTEKFESIMAHLGDSYEAKLAKAVGPERAAELRNIRDGWGASTVAGGECDPPDQ